MRIIILLLTITFIASCTAGVDKYVQAETLPALFPDIAGVTIPSNIAPLNFYVEGGVEQTLAEVTFEQQTIRVKSSDSTIQIPSSKWHKLITEAKGKELQITVYAQKDEKWIRYQPLSIAVAEEPIDQFLAYRLIPPGYQLWNDMGIYQTDLTTANESTIYENKVSKKNCINCHSFANGSPRRMIFHARGDLSGTVVIREGEIEILNTKTDSTQGTFTYPSWHPSGRFIAFSSNSTNQVFHANDKNRIEVFDSSSEILVYDTETHTIATPFAPSQAKRSLNTYPTFSPDGRTLYFCSAPFKEMPENFESLQYSLCSISFDPQTMRFGSTVDTLVSSTHSGRSVTFPRLSPCGRFMLFTTSSYGCFPIWHRDADLMMIDIETRQLIDCSSINSSETESYHSWSSNGRWIVFSSRRIDGLYTRPYFAYVGKDGKLSKPFLFPHQSPLHFARLMKSYNLPEFMTEECSVDSREIAEKLREKDRVQVKFSR